MSRRRPNILWICTDHQRFDTLGCYGNQYVKTPNIDRLANEGVLFENCFCQNPFCTPSRASFLTGRYPSTTKDRSNGRCMPESEVLVTRMLSDSGYHGGLSGKLHISACHRNAVKDVERRINDGYHEFYWSHHPAPDWPTNEYIHWLKEKGQEYGSRPFEGSDFISEGMSAEHHHTTWCAQKAEEFIKARSGSKQPWHFTVNTYDPHYPFNPPRELLDRYLEKIDEIPLPNYVEGELENKPANQSAPHRYNRDKMKDRDHRLVRAAFWAMIDLIDEQVGRLLKVLDETGQRENTVVVFMSDHGEMLGDHGWYLKGDLLYEPAIKVPLIVSCPKGIKSGVRCKGLVELVDLAPTLCDLAGVEHHPGMQGQSLMPVLRGESDGSDHREDVYCEFSNANAPGDKGAQTTMVRTREHKLVAHNATEEYELYDLVKDPGENVNQWDQPEYANTKVEMLQRLVKRMAYTADPLPERVASY